MNIQLTEEIIRQRANAQSYQKGRDYYASGSIFNPSWQSTPGGVALMAHCEGNSAPSYQLRAELDSGGVQIASCTCPYDRGGDCKHIVALLLTYLHRPEKFSEQKSLDELLVGLEKDALLGLINRLAQNDPDLYDEIELVLPAILLTAQPQTAAQSKEKRQTQVSEQAYRKQVKRILKQSRYEEDYHGDWGSAPAYISDLEAIQETAEQFLAADDADGALIILQVLLEETLDDYDGEMDYDGYVASFIQGLGMPMTEAILSVEMDGSSHKALQDFIEDILDDLDEVIEASDLEVVLIALEYGWKQLPDKETEWEEYEEETWMLFDDLQQVRLNVLERQNRTEEFLQLAQAADMHRYILKLLDLGRVDDAIAASRELEDNGEILSVAQKLRQLGKINDAVALAERGLEQQGYRLHELALWLAPLEESLGRKEMALLAYRTAYNAQPSIEIYRRLKRLSGSNWEKLRLALVQQVIDDASNPSIMVDIHLEEQEWDAAITIAEKQTWAYNLLEKVADTVITSRPDWVIRVALKQADDLIVKTQSNLYPAAAQWLGRAKKAYHHKNQAAEWQAYITNLRTTYARRPALQKAIANL
jgi:uncharacterized Zn finger protein